MSLTIAVQGPDDAAALWEPITLDRLGKNEDYLEKALSRTPELLCLEAKRTGIYGPFAVFNQLPLGTPQGRTIYPDIVLLAASGDVVIVEVKLFANPELKDRRVIAQAIDYVSSLSALTEGGIVRLFNGGRDADWTNLVRGHFPNERDPDELSAALLANAHDGNVHIVVACDKVPKGVYEMAKSVSAQSHLGFSLDVVEVSPFVPKVGPADQIMFVPNVRMSTDIVARTAISVTYEAGSPQPGVAIETTSVEAIEENLATAAQGVTRQSRQRDWTDQEIAGVFLAVDDPTVRDLFLFAQQESYDGQIQSDRPKASAAFGFYMCVRLANGDVGGRQFFYCVDGSNNLVLRMKWPTTAVPEAALDEYRSELKAALGSAVDAPEPNIPLALVAENLEGFKDAIRKLQRRIAPKPVDLPSL